MDAIAKYKAVKDKATNPHRRNLDQLLQRVTKLVDYWDKENWPDVLDALLIIEIRAKLLYDDINIVRDKDGR